MNLKNWFQQKFNLPGPLPESLSSLEIAEFYFRKGFFAFLRGGLIRWRFKTCGRNFFLGKGCSIYFPRFLSMGDDVVIGAHSVISGFSEKGMCFGNRVHIREYAWIQATSGLHHPGVGLSIGDNTYIGPYSYLGAGGGLTIGRNVVIGAQVHLLAENHRFQDQAKPIREQGVTRKGIVIKDDVWIGNQVIILDGVELGQGSVVGAGAVVTHTVPAGAVVAGNPARVIGQRGEAPA